MNEHEKIYNVMKLTGALSLAMGIVVMSIGLLVGICNIICGVSLLKKKSDITF